ncbi:MAG: hypothetical protein Q7R95_00950 [bacterium]|nr:hypothetical protein [bacterium]
MNKYKELQIRTIRNFNTLQDFHVFTGYSYDRYEKMVKAGNIKESVYNVRTHNSVKEVELAKILLEYLDEDLPKIVIYQLVSYFDDFFADYLKFVLLKGNINITQNFTDLRKKINISRINSNDEKRIIELRESRNVIAHRSEIVDKDYIKNVGSFARVTLNSVLPFERPYVYDSADFLKDLVNNLTDAAMKANLS